MNLLDMEIPSIQGHAERPWSPLQAAIFSAVAASPSQNILIQAVAGSGKTTTIIKAMEYAPGSSLFMAFNKSIAEDIRRKVSSGDVKTLNALGHRLWMQNSPRSSLESRKVSLILEALLGRENQLFKDYAYPLSRIIGIAKNQAWGVAQDISNAQTAVPMEPASEAFEDLIDSYQFDIPQDLIPELSQVCAKAFLASLLDRSTFDFDDQLFMPCFYGWRFPSYSNVFVDECQDLSPIQHMMLERLKEEGSRIVAVGDRHQAIYGFRGASTNSMDLLKTQFSMLELPLSISYRCAQSIIAEAQIYCPTILPREGAPIGNVSWSEEDPQLFPSGWLILCRNNAPMFAVILRHVRARKPCRVLTNFLDSFQSFIRGFKVERSVDLQRKLDAWFTKEVEAAKAKNFRGKIEYLEDKYNTVKLFCKEFTLVSEILDCVKKLQTGTSGPIFSTIHKAKGLESESVYILRPDLMPSRYASTEEAMQQEENMIYVAVTRAKEVLVYGQKPGWGK